MTSARKIGVNETGRRLIALRKKKHISQSDVAKKLGISYRTYAKFEIGEIKKPGDKKKPVEIKIEYLVKLSRLFGVSVDYLLGLSDHATTWDDVPSITGLSAAAVDALRRAEGDGYTVEALSWLLENRAGKYNENGNALRLIHMYVESDPGDWGIVDPADGCISKTEKPEDGHVSIMQNSYRTLLINCIEWVLFDMSERRKGVSN